MSPSITTILCIFERPHSLAAQVQAIKEQTIPSKEIWIWQNASEKKDLQFKIPPEVNVYIKSSRNFKFHGRFALGLLAQTEYVAIFDDDTIPGKKWFENCLNCMKVRPGLYGTIGVLLPTAEYTTGNKVGWEFPNKEIKEVDLVGHAWFLKQEWLRHFWNEPVTSFQNGEDIQLSFALQKHKIYTFVPPHLLDRKEEWGSLRGKEFGRDDVAHYRREGAKQHAQERTFVVQECIKRGWQTCQIRSPERFRK